MRRFEGKSIILTGAATGIGAATARYLAREGARLMLIDRSEAVKEVAAEVGGFAFVCDLASDLAPTDIADEARSLFDGVDVLVNNAGVGGARPLSETSDEFLDNILNINLRSTIRLIREIEPILRRPGGVIINTGSTLGLAGTPNMVAYGVSKGGIAQLTRQLAAELGPAGIRVNAVAPGVIETRLNTDRIHHDEYYQCSFISAAPTRTYGQPEDIAAAVAFLASDEARFISGQILAVDGGWLEARHPPRNL